MFLKSKQYFIGFGPQLYFYLQALHEILDSTDHNSIYIAYSHSRKRNGSGWGELGCNRGAAGIANVAIPKKYSQVRSSRKSSQNHKRPE